MVFPSGSAPRRPNIERFWSDLLSSIERRRVIPVIGAELLVIHKNGQPVPLYREVADRLLAQYGLEPLSLERYGLFEAVSRVAATGQARMNDLYWSVPEIIEEVTRNHPEALAPLKDLAGIDDFDLFVTTTPDDLLARALNSVHFEGTEITLELKYAPNQAGTKRRDIPEDIAEGKAVFYLFGKGEAGPFFAIHDEDALEFAYRLQTGSGPERMLSRIRESDLLLIGCTFAEGLNRFFLRLSNTDRLSERRGKREYLVGRETTLSDDFVIFLERFSQNSRCQQTDAATFVAHLKDRWLDRNPPAARAPRAAASPSPLPISGGIFVSYAREDLVAAKRVCERLKSISDTVVWFDKREITPGDAWDDRIRIAVQKCDLFVPLLSKGTEARSEGYFRNEWSSAAERMRSMEGRPFIVPLVIDQDYRDEAAARYLVPDRFKSLHFGHAPEGRIDDALLETIRDKVRALRRPQ